MKKSMLKFSLILSLFITFAFANLSASRGDFPDKALDRTRHHNVGNAWLRVANYGTFGGNGSFPSLEYPGGSSIDYLYVGGLWFGAQKIRRNATGQQLFWRVWPPENNNDFITQFIRVDGVETLHPEWRGLEFHRAVVDTLTTVAIDDLYSFSEFLPAWNPLEYLRSGYNTHNRNDRVVEASTRTHRRGQDNDGDGFINEDPLGRTFPFRRDLRGDGTHLPATFHDFTGKFVHELGSHGTQIISDNYEIWFPLGFQDLSYTDFVLPMETRFNFTEVWDDDHDLIIDEDGAPVSEQDFISYYYDYSPFEGASYSPTNRMYGVSTSRNVHMPLNIRIRQMSYQWSYEFIKNLTYVEFNITNMNPQDTLYNCVMGIYMDSVTGPQSWDLQRKLKTDVSGYVAGINMEFAYTREKIYDTITPHWIGARVVNPDPEKLDYATWVWSWNPGFGPDDWDPLNYGFTSPLVTKRTANEKYWLLSGRNPDTSKYINMRERAVHESTTSHYEQDLANDTLYLFSFFGDMKGYDDPTPDSWNLKPFETMKIVLALFPGENIEDLKTTARWAKNIYGRSQLLHEVVLPDTFPHYEPPEPPQHPIMFSKIVEEPAASNNININVYWSNRSESSIDYFIVDKGQLGWQVNNPNIDSYIDNWDPSWPSEFAPEEGNWTPAALVNPYTAWRLRHSFQGYTLWGRSGRGEREAWIRQEMWDKLETEQDEQDYFVNFNEKDVFIELAGDTGIEKGLPNRLNGDDGFVTIEDISPGGILHNFCLDGESYVYTTQGDDYIYRPIEVGDIVYGKPIYNTITAEQAQALAHEPLPIPPFLTDQQRRDNQLLFKHPDLDEEIFLALVEDSLIPLRGHWGQYNINEDDRRSVRNSKRTNTQEIIEKRYERLSRRYYETKIYNVPKGREYYVSVTAWSRGIPSEGLGALESGRDANMMVFFTGPVAQESIKNVYVVPNPYRGSSTFDGSADNDPLGDRSRRLWFVNLPARANVQIFTLSGDLVDEFEHYPGKALDVISISREVREAVGSGGIHSWNLLSRNNQIIASGLYFFSVKCHDTGNVQVGRFVVIR